MLFKRVFDLCSSLFGIFILSPFFITISITVKLTSPGPVFFRQKRIGLKMAPFNIYKFRTMKYSPDAPGISITSANDSRVTSVGKFLRKWKIDELPQLINILKGDMSFVGPRPEVPEYVYLYTEEQKKVLSVRPGLTDPGSIIYSNEESLFPDDPAEREKIYINTILPDKLRLNLEYIKKRSFWRDMKVLLTTLKCIIISRENPSLNNSATLELTTKKSGNNNAED